MTFVQLLHVLRLYGADVLLLAIGVTLTTTLLKKTLLRRIKSKYYVLVPFALGLVYFAVYRMIVTCSPSPLTEELGATVDGGLSCGCAATLLYVVYEQFFRKGKSVASPLSPLLCGVVEESMRETLASEILSESAALDGEELLMFLREKLASAAPELAPAELEIRVRLIAEVTLSLRQ